MLNFTDKSAPWYARITGKGDNQQVFIHHQFGSAQAVICVGLDGYDYNKYNRRDPIKWQHSTRGYNIHWAANAGMQMTFQDFRDVQTAITEAVWELSKPDA